MEHCYRLWDEMSNIGVQGKDEALTHCLQTIAKWIQADHAFWVGLVRLFDGTDALTDFMGGWRIGALHELHATDGYSYGGKIRRAGAGFASAEPGETSLAALAGAGHFRAYALRAGDLVDYDSFRKTERYDIYYRRHGIGDRIWVGFPINEYAESFCCFDKFGSYSRFTDNDKQMAAQALRGIKWFHRQQLLSHGLGVSDIPLSHSERRVLHELFTGDPEGVIAERLGLTVGTTHQYITNIFRKFGVSGRAGLMSLWFSGEPSFVSK